MSRRDLDAAGILDPGLRDSYERCRVLNSQHGKTYYLATLLLPPAKRPYVHALYGFARYADEIVDVMGRDDQAAASQLKGWGDAFLADVRRGRSDDPVGRAVVDTVQRWDIPIEHFEAFLESMTMDLTITDYATYDDLSVYVYGSASVIGLQMVPILEPLEDGAYVAAQDLGVAFQLANFVRDVGEDLERGRVYLPLEDLDRFGLTAPTSTSGGRRPGQGPPAVPDRPGPPTRGGRPARDRAAAPDQPPVHRGRQGPLLRHR